MRQITDHAAKIVSLLKSDHISAQLGPASRGGPDLEAIVGDMTDQHIAKVTAFGS